MNQPGTVMDAGDTHAAATALITGASGGLGGAIVLALRARGWNILATGRDKTALRSLEEDPCSAGRVRSFPADLRQRNEYNALIDFVTGSVNRLALLVNNAGVAFLGRLEQIDDHALADMLSVNLAVPIRLVRDLLPLLRAASGACVVNVASEQVLRPGAANSAYGATKSGLVFLTRSWAAELSADAIRVNCVLPGAVDTGMLRRAVAPADVRVPLGRLVAPEDVAAAVCMLADAEMITGASLIVDGGTSLTT
jgi:meso-butanediol dehydrogenase / (S,S)-butanediol dehydrogenase / diacetyl reductase